MQNAIKQTVNVKAFFICTLRCIRIKVSSFAPEDTSELQQSCLKLSPTTSESNWDKTQFKTNTPEFSSSAPFCGASTSTTWIWHKTLANNWVLRESASAQFL